MTFVSSRKIPLICQTVGALPVITMENYPKWYGLEVIHPNGTVEDVDPDLLDELCGDKPLMGDHNYHPDLLKMVANRLGGIVDQVSLYTAAGRWQVEVVDECNEYSYSAIHRNSSTWVENTVSEEIAQLTLFRMKWLSENMPDCIQSVRILYRPNGTLVLNDVTATISDLDKLGVPTSMLQMYASNYLLKPV